MNEEYPRKEKNRYPSIIDFLSQPFDVHHNTILKELCFTIVTVKILNRCFKKWLIYSERSCHKGSICLKGGWALFGRIPFERFLLPTHSSTSIPCATQADPATFFILHRRTQYIIVTDPAIFCDSSLKNTVYIIVADPEWNVLPGLLFSTTARQPSLEQ